MRPDLYSNRSKKNDKQATKLRKHTHKKEKTHTIYTHPIHHILNLSYSECDVYKQERGVDTKKCERRKKSESNVRGREEENKHDDKAHGIE